MSRKSIRKSEGKKILLSSIEYKNALRLLFLFFFYIIFEALLSRQINNKKKNSDNITHCAATLGTLYKMVVFFFTMLSFVYNIHSIKFTLHIALNTE